MSDIDVERGLYPICENFKAYVEGNFNLRRAKMPYGSSLSIHIGLLGHIVEYLKQWTPNERGLLSRRATARLGTDENLVVKRKL